MEKVDKFQSRGTMITEVKQKVTTYIQRQYSYQRQIMNKIP